MMNFIQKTLAEKCLQDFGFSVALCDSHEKLHFFNPVKKTAAIVQMSHDTFFLDLLRENETISQACQDLDSMYMCMKNFVRQ